MSEYPPQYVYDSRLIVEPGFWDLTPEQLAEIANGCGAKSSRLDLVPDCILGADVWLACAIHDYAYSLGRCKHDADRAFLYNLLVLCDSEHPAVYLPRYKVCCAYFEAVYAFGGSSFGCKEAP